MSTHRTSISFTNRGDVLEKVVAVLAKHHQDDYYAYERDGNWFVSLGNQSTLLLDSKEDKISIITASEQTSHSITGSSVSNFTRDFIGKHLKPSGKIFSQVRFNYASHIHKEKFKPGQ